MNLLQVMCKRQVFHLTGKVWTALIEYFLQDFSNALMIKTAAEGHNSGRTYYLQASSKEQCIEMEKLIKSLSTRAREKAAARTQFAKVQLGARKLFSSYWFQTGSATLIIAVCSLAAPRGSNSNSNEINVNWHWHHAARAVPDSPSRQNFLVSIFESQYGRMMTLGNGLAATPSTHISVVDFQERQDDNNTDFNQYYYVCAPPPRRGHRRATARFTPHILRSVRAAPSLPPARSRLSAPRRAGRRRGWG